MTNQQKNTPTRIDYRKFMAWVGLNGPRPSNVELAFYLEIELGNREEVDAVEVAVWLEAIETLKVTTSNPTPDRDAFYVILRNYIPSETIDQAWQELREAELVS